MEIAIGTASVYNADKFILPYIKSISKFDLVASVKVANGVPNKNTYFGIENVHYFDKMVSYATCLNLCLREMDKWNPNWYLLTNDDMLCEGKFIDTISKLDQNFIYGTDVQSRPWGKYVVGHLILIHNKVRKLIGDFDENFTIASCEDVDYSYRCLKEGIYPKKINIPFKHLGGKTRYSVEKYSESRVKNEEYLNRKHGL